MLGEGRTEVFACPVCPGQAAIVFRLESRRHLSVVGDSRGVAQVDVILDRLEGDPCSHLEGVLQDARAARG